MFPRRRCYCSNPYARYVYGRSRPNSWLRDAPWVRNAFPGSTSLFPTATPKPETTKPKAEIPPVPKTELATKLHVTGVDLHIADNTKTHNTDMYECTQDRVSGDTKKKARLVLRRGQEFTMTIQFDRAYDIKKNDITFDFSLGGEDEDKQKVIKSFRLEESGAAPYKPRKWGANLVKKKEKSLTVSVFIPASSSVGEWELSVSTVVDVKDGEDIVWKYNHDEEVIVLFNPWCKEDLVYMADKDWLKEAVLNDSGCVYLGLYSWMDSSPWYFGQFEDQVLEASLHLLRKAFKFNASPALGSIVRVTRALSKIVNSIDDAGVLVGNWSGNYFGGTSPSTWSGSVKILKQYMTTTKPVKYGQCWVYSCVLTTVCRALGIPCRSVTNFESAHNTDKEHLSCDTYNYKLPNGELEEERIDSVWNFHVWNEAWMSRPDLTDSEGGGLVYDGWQVIDATPQEESDGSYQCGPCPVIAVKEGHVNVGLDTAFVFAEVNGDKVEWLVDPKKKIFIQLSRDRNAIGKCISTHAPTGEPYKKDEDDTERLDITREYKYEEGSKEERAAFRRAERTFRLANFDGEEGEEPTPVEAVELTLEEIDGVYLGSEFDFKSTVRNTGDLARTVTISLKATNTDYTGKTLATVAEKKIADLVMNVGDVKVIKVKVDTMLDLDKPKRGSTYVCKAVATVKESGNSLKTSRRVYVRNPPLKITGPEKCKKEGQVTVKVSFNNTLRKPLTNCKLGVEGNMKCVDESQQEMTIGKIGAGKTWSTDMLLKMVKSPKYIPMRAINIILSCDEVKDVVGMYKVGLV
ncbi:protein-glutamine gamma-glutamyltransferase E-like [Haliotis rufescens]|uniref:protein-glutamine gamma-glutamyltransferase E-like n=1 Tax=Haliotis rufescens TaxID=6454 RepID=UPI00201EBEAC|nr:protein-glutamine gamma-glutamyltransferase E-like [Haliotis rufescens]